MHGRAVVAVNPMYLTIDIQANMTECDTDVTEYHRTSCEEEVRVTRWEDERQMEVDHDSVQPLSIPASINRYCGTRPRNFSKLTVFAGVLLRLRTSTIDELPTLQGKICEAKAEQACLIKSVERLAGEFSNAPDRDG